MDLELTLKDACNGLKSIRATERKKSAENLKEFLTRNAVPSLLNENTLKNKGYTWNNVFDDINEYILKETEKYETSKTYDAITGPLCSSLLHLCVTGANKGKAYLKCEKITEICLYVLNDNRLSKVIGDAYLNLLFKYILPCEYYLDYMTPKIWKDMWNVCVASCVTNNYKLDHFTKLRLVLLVLKSAKENSQFVRPVIDSLPLLEKYLLKISNDKKLQDVITEVMILLLEMLSSEYRLTICHFLEIMLSSVLKFYDANKDQKKKVMLFKLLHHTIALHHPQGRRQHEEGSLANNWEQWNRSLNSITELICLEVFWLYEHNDNEDESASKRLRLNFNKNKHFSDLIMELQQNLIPWMAIVNSYVKNYYSSLSTTDFSLLLNCLHTILTNNNGNLDWDIFEELTCMALQNLYSLMYKNEDNDNTLISLWNSCIRNCTSVIASHKPMHTILQKLLETDTVKYPQVQQLVKLYLESDIPLTTHTVKSLSTVFQHWYSKVGSEDCRAKCLLWLTACDISSVCIKNVAEIIFRLLANENVNIIACGNVDSEYKNLREILFDSNEKCILFTEFEIDNSITLKKTEKRNGRIETVEVIENQIKEYFKTVLMEAILKLRQKEANLLNTIKLINLVISYLDILLVHNINSQDEVKSMEVFGLLKTILSCMYSALNTMLQSNTHIPVKLNALQLVKELLITEFHYLLTSVLRSSIDGDLFHTINNVLNTEVETSDGNVSVDEDEDEMNFNSLKHNCFFVLAAYCRKEAEYRDELVKLILDDGMYNFDTDLQCIFQTIDILTEANVKVPPLGLVLTLLQTLCRKLYRNSKASYGILKILVNNIDKLCLHDNIRKNNCFIMIKSYLQLCADMYYPPKVAALVYECAAKLLVLNQKQDEAIDRAFQSAFITKIKGEILDDENQLVLKDESANRTFTVLHCYFALAQAHPSDIQSIILEVMNLQKAKCLDKKTVFKVLNRIAKTAGIEDLTSYLNYHILSIIHYWFSKHNTVNDLPITLFGYDDMDSFLENHKGWLIAGQILWFKEGNVVQSDILKYVAESQTLPVQNVLETCFPNVIALCLPYIVSEKYGVEYYPLNKRNDFKRALKNADRMFIETHEILKNDRWNNLFVENIGDLLMLAASHVRDYDNTEEEFGIKLRPQRQYYYYPKSIFSAILQYFESITDESIVHYLCKNQTITILKILFKLWKDVMQEKIFEYKALAMHAFVTFLKNFPVGLPSDAFVCNYACNSFTQAIKHCNETNLMKVLVKGLRIVLDYFLPHTAPLMKKTLLELLPVLVIKREKGFEQECASLLNYLLNDMKDLLTGSNDVVDFLNSMSQGIVDNSVCATMTMFKEKLRAHKISLSRPSHKTLLKLRQFLTCNNDNTLMLYRELESKRFSEDCETSLVHQIIYELCNILKSPNDEKTIIEACNCLSEISSYDLKTLVTVSPINTDGIKNVNPKAYFIQVTVKALLGVIFDEDPNVTNEVSAALIKLLQCFDINDVTEIEDVDKEILKPLSSTSTITNDTHVDGLKFEQYYTIFPDGIFLNALLSKNKDDWLREVTCTLLEFVNSSTDFVNSLREVCILKSHVCHKILPALLGLLLECLSDKRVQAVGKHINKLFNYIYEQTFDNKLESSGNSIITSTAPDALPDGHKVISQYMLDIVDFVRMQRSFWSVRPGCPKKRLNFLELEYDKVAWAAAYIDQNWAAIYYGELWGVFQNSGVSPCSPEATTNLPGGEILQIILRKCYVSIGEMDAVEGCGTAHLTIENEKHKHLINTGQYSDALLLHDIALSYGTQSECDLQYGVVRSLHKSGMHNLALRYIKSLPESDNLNDVKYECLSFLGDWSDFVDTKELAEKHKLKGYNPHSVLKAFQYACLKNCLHIQTTPEFEDKLMIPLNNAKLTVSRLCHNLNLENCENIYKILEKLHTFRDIEDYYEVRRNRLNLLDLLKRWDVENVPQFHDFKHIEALASQRVLILEHAAKSHTCSMNEIVSLQVKYAKIALNNNRVQMAQRLLAIASKSQMNNDIALVESEVSWAKGHKELALSLLRNIVNNQPLDTKLAAISLRRYALWMADSKHDTPRDIVNKYLQKSLQVLRQEDVDVRLSVYRDIAKFADAEYKQVVSYMNSSIFENRVKCVENMKGTETSLSKRITKSLSKEEGRALSTNRRFKELDEAEIANTRAERENFLQLAMRYYLLSLKECNESNLSVFRVISLWLSNRDFEFQGDDSDTFEDLLHAIPSWKFVTILPQLAPRVTNEDTAFIRNLKILLKRCAVDHPHHTLPILFLLKNSDKDSVILNASGSIGSANRAREQETRTLAAQALVAQLRHHNNDLTIIIDQMEKMCDAMISFANHVPTSRSKKQKIPDAENIHKLRNLSAIPVPTVTLPVKHDCTYSHIQTLHSFETYYELVGGMNCPKKINCLESSGKKHILLIKGGDDMKQDAVMQQVFNIVNTLLEKDPVTNRNKLLIRTYKVVPLSRLSGVLEWCEGTEPIGMYLAGTENRGAHARYRPQDMSCEAARKKMIESCNENTSQKLAIFKRIMKEFKPVFHYYFTEHYLDPVTWYERRLAYTKSVATSSMVGYILGLGDRHVYNILIDQRTAEVIHIDLGIAFDQGKTLRTPETVPFRLTRDIIAGFGCSGIEGIFRRCCEKTMQLLRDNQETLLTILEVLLCDPLYSWSVKTAQQNAPATSMHNKDLCTTGPPSGLAKRALLVVTSKLSGTEDGVAGGVAVAGQVARLLRAATDPFNLCRLFHGWQPYL
ncbi:unnamed protein product [Arctia plantaginis]|uniref:non-specific serine/threonine protein kinase n=1 Tax=Arctia plantaginis TaxID=874455 RepID=A0A8S0ZEG5_ARCPL|nr:unnamed protein product [Arctia plantaginis]